MNGTFTNVTSASEGVGQTQFLSSIGGYQDHATAPFSASGVSALQSMMTDYLNRCNASSSVPASQMTTQIPLSNHNEARNLQIEPRSSSFYQGQSVDNGTALHQSIQKLQSELQEINGRIQRQPNLSDEVKVKASQKVEESAKNTPSIIIAPCPARGMPFDHNYKTANFTISKDETRHGDELVCSYFNCRKVGIKFLYCSFCKLPVPKRNFCKFHSHSEEIMNEEKPAKKQETPALESICPSPQGTPLFTEMAREPDGPVNKKRKRSKTTQKTQDTCKKSKSLKIKKHSPPDSDFDDKNHGLWVELLHERPSANNRKKMSIWLSQVLRVSEACTKSHKDKVSLVKYYADSN